MEVTISYPQMSISPSSLLLQEPEFLNWAHLSSENRPYNPASLAAIWLSSGQLYKVEVQSGIFGMFHKKEKVDFQFLGHM